MDTKEWPSLDDATDESLKMIQRVAATNTKVDSDLDGFSVFHSASPDLQSSAISRFENPV